MEYDKLAIIILGERKKVTSNPNESTANLCC